MAYVFVYSSVAIAQALQLMESEFSTHFVLLSVSSWNTYQYNTTIYKQIQSKLAAFFNMAVGLKLSLTSSLKLSFKASTK